MGGGGGSTWWGMHAGSLPHVSGHVSAPSREHINMAIITHHHLITPPAHSDLRLFADFTADYQN